ncbi:hypothetical protein ACTACG_21660 [Pseudomonas syringae]|nr:hypothetical protein [Pseudomonas syringae]
MLLANAKLAQRLKDNHQRLLPNVNGVDGLSHLDSGRSQKGKLDA